jgi:ribosome-binding protein aMBF1 (putative translation factor)
MAAKSSPVAREFGKWVRDQRHARGWSQDQLARALDLHHRTVQKWESGESEPKLSQILKVRDEFGWPPMILRLVDEDQSS